MILVVEVRMSTYTAVPVRQPLSAVADCELTGSRWLTVGWSDLKSHRQSAEYGLSEIGYRGLRVMEHRTDSANLHSQGNRIM